MVSVVKKLLPGAAGTAGAGGGDDDFNLVANLFHFNGSNAAQNSTFIDSSDNNLTVTAGSDVPAQGTFSPFSADPGKWSVQFSGTDFIKYSNADFGFGTADYTVECFVFFTGNATTSGGIFQTSWGTGDGTSPAMALRDSTGLTIYTSSGQKKTGNNNTFKMGVWYHLAYVRASNVVKVYVDGSLVTWDDGTSTAADTTNIGNAFAVGRYYSDDYTLDGYLSNFRVNKGTAVYTGAFTKPTAPLTDITNTVLLTCKNNHFNDESSEGNNPNSYNSNPKVTPFSPFKNTAEYDPAVHGGSFLFTQNANSSLSVSHATLFDFGTADHCIEAWLYPTQTSFNTSWAMWASAVESGTTNYWAYTDGGGNEAIAGFSNYGGTGGVYSASNDHILQPFSWNHCVFQVTGGVENWYLNGTRIYNNTNNPNYSSNITGMMFGRANAYSSNYFYGGYMTDVRVTTGNNYNPYSNASTLTVPTAPLTKGSYTRLLLNGTNAGIIDSSRKSNIYVYGNTQLDTSVKKFGTASGEFDETGDYLVIHPSAYSHYVDLGSGAFTIEGWVYFNSSPTDGQGLFQFDNAVLNSANGRGPALGTYSGTGKWHRYWGQVGDVARYDGVGDSASVPAATTWIHFAYVRDQSHVHKVFIDGTQIGSSITYEGDYTGNKFLTIGGYYNSNYLLNGYIDDFRITLKARYTSNFTVPDAQHPSI